MGRELNNSATNRQHPFKLQLSQEVSWY